MTVIRSARLATGVTLPYVESGDAAGAPLVMLHGITDSWRSFELVLPHLPPTIRALAVTQRGHGDADRPANGYRARDFAADVAAFLDALGIERAVVLGHSMGSANALRTALDHPAHVHGLILAGAFAGFRDKAELVAYVERDIAALTDPIDPAFARAFQESTLAQPIPPAFLDTAAAESLKLPARVWHAAFAGLFDDGFYADLGPIAVPTLLLWGAHDTYSGQADQDRLLATIRGARLVTYADAGHALHWEEPARFAADVARFVEGVPR